MLQSLFAFKRDAKSIVDLSYHQVVGHLKKALEQRRFVEVHLPHDDITYQSLILELDEDEQTILIDELFPNIALVTPGRSLQFSIRQPRGRLLKFQSRVLEVYSYDNAPLYVVAMPKMIDYDQRRNAYRFSLDSRLTVAVDFIAPDNKVYYGRIGDISASGLSLFLPESFDCELTEGDRLANANFVFAQLPITSDLTVRNVRDNVQAEAEVRIGVEFEGLSARRERELGLTIMQLQRQQLRSGC